MTVANDEALKAFDNREKWILHELERQYAEMLEELTAKVDQMNAQAVSLLVGSDDKSKAQAQSKVYQYEYQKRMKEQISAILDKLRANEYETIEQFLQDSYTNGYVGTLHEFAEQGVPVIAPIDQEAVVRAIQIDSKLSKPLYDTLGQDLTKLKTQVRQEITRGIATNLTTNDIARNLQNVSGISLGRAKTIARTESHRIRETASFDAGLVAKDKGADLVKEWVATRDTRVRDTHRRLDGQFRELEEEFEIDGKKALFPGSFGRPEEDCNCYCHTNKVLRWLLGEEELQRMHERAAIWGLEDDEGKVAQYKEYEKRFLKRNDEVDAIFTSYMEESGKKLEELSEEEMNFALRGAMDRLSDESDNYPELYSATFGYLARTTDISVSRESKLPYAYKHSIRTVLVNPEAKNFSSYPFEESVLHELAHRYDKESVGTWTNKNFTESLTKAKETGKMITEKLEEMVARHYEDGFVQDTIYILSSGLVDTIYHHTNLEFDDECREVFANLASLGAKEASGFYEFKKLFPDLVKAFEASFGG